MNRRPFTAAGQVARIATVATGVALVLAAAGTTGLHWWQQERIQELEPGHAPALVPYMLAYVVVWTGVLLAHRMVVKLLVSRALAPLAQAAAAAAGVTGLGGTARLDETGPMEVRTLLAAVNALLGRLERAFGAQSRFTSEAAHELRTPLTALRGEIELALRRERTPEEYRTALREALAGVERLGEVAEGLLALSQVDAGRAEFDREPEHARAIAQRAVAREVGPQRAEGANIRVEVTDDPILHVHGALAELALGNLLRNATRYSDGGPVLLTVTRDGPALAFIVDDAGPGVPLEEREAVFDRFTRGAAARQRHPDGSGLGLSFAREVARRHGGDCVLETSPLGGCRARLTIRVP